MSEVFSTGCTPSATNRALVTSAAAAFIQREDRRVLLVHHAHTKRWVMPGGKVEAGETPLQCCEREGQEETGLPGEARRLLVVQWLSGRRGPYTNPYPCHLFVFSGAVAPQDYDRVHIPETELLGWGWWAPETALTLMDETNAPLLAAALQAHCRSKEGPLYLEDDLQPSGSQEVRR